MKDKVLIVEDEVDIAALIKVHLTELALDCDICHDGEQALALALTNDYQLILLDVMLPSISGLDICRQVRQEKPLQAILMLTSKTSEIDRVLGLELGADDYMTKPFSIRELQARVRTQLRRMHALSYSQSKREEQHNSTPEKTTSNDHVNINNTTYDNTHESKRNTICIGDLVIDHNYHKVTYKNQQIRLTTTEFELIDFFCQHPDQVFSRAQLLDGVWGYHHSGYEHTVNSHINRLRNKLEEDCADPQIIQTVWGVGYKLNSVGVTAESH
jgi:DNA-binding response OmpR family regulator